MGSRKPGITRRVAFAAVLSGCDAEFALRVDPLRLADVSSMLPGAPLDAKTTLAQPYILIIGSRTRSIRAEAYGTSSSWSMPQSEFTAASEDRASSCTCFRQSGSLIGAAAAA